MSDKERDLSIVIRCGNDKKGLLRCINSIDTSVEIVISASNEADFLHEKPLNEYIHTRHSYGNWSIAAENGLQATTLNDVIIMDSDATFSPGAIGIINSYLKQGHRIVQPTVEFLTDNSRFSQVISSARSHENRFEPKAFSPGLGLKKKELIESIGVNGHLYNPKVLYGDDGYLDQTAKAAGIEIFVAKNALIYHDPVPLKHEIKDAFRFGQGEYQLEEQPTSVKSQVNQMLTSNEAKAFFKSARDKYGQETFNFILFWRLVYIAGFIYEKSKHPK